MWLAGETQAAQHRNKGERNEPTEAAETKAKDPTRSGRHRAGGRGVQHRRSRRTRRRGR